MLKQFSIPLVALGIMALAASDMYAQGGHRTRGVITGMGGGLVAMVRNDKIKTELELDDTQVEKMIEFAQNQREEMRDKLQKLREDGGSMADVRTAMEQFQAESRKVEDELVSELLNEKQLIRYRQLRLQLMGNRALRQPEVAEAIGLSSDDIQAIDDAITAGVERIGEAIREMRATEDRNTMRKRLTELGKQIEESVLEILSDEQRQKFEEMKGEKFEFPQPGSERRGRDREDF